MVEIQSADSAVDIVQEGSALVNAKGENVPCTSLKGKVVGFYFSAHWCPPCRGFTPSLVKFYNEMKKKHDDFEIVFVSSDKSKAEQMSYMTDTSMPWVALPHGDPRSSALSKIFGVAGIPCLGVVNAAGDVATSAGRADVAKHGAEECYTAWSQGKPLEKSDGAGMSPMMIMMILFALWKLYQMFFNGSA